jgi:hypothetical protein
MSKFTVWAKTLPAKAKVLLKAWPTWAAVITGVVSVVAQDVIPHLPGDWPVKAAAYVAAGISILAAITAAVSRVTPILFPEEKGILPLPEAPVLEFDRARLDPDAVERLTRRPR